VMENKFLISLKLQIQVECQKLWLRSARKIDQASWEEIERIEIDM